MNDLSFDAWCDSSQFAESGVELSDISAGNYGDNFSSANTPFDSLGNSSIVDQQAYHLGGQTYCHEPDQNWSEINHNYSSINGSGGYDAHPSMSTDVSTIHFGSSDTTVTLSDSVCKYDKSDFTEAADGTLYKSTSDYTSGKNGYKPG